MIEIPCPECLKKLRVDECNAGKRAKCPKCGARISIPITEAPSQYDLHDARSDSQLDDATDEASVLATKDQAEQSNDDPWDEVEDHPAPRKRNSKSAKPSKTQTSRSPMVYVGIGGGAVLIVLMIIGTTLWLSGALAKPPEHRAQDVAQQVGKAEENNEPNLAGHEKTSAELFTKGSTVLDSGDNESALLAFSKAIDADNQSAPAFNGRGVAYLRLEKLKPALADFTRAIELKPDEAKFYGNRAFLYQDQGNFGLALADLSMAIKLEPQSPQWYQQRALVFSLMDDTDHEKSDLTHAETLEREAKNDDRPIVERPQRTGLLNAPQLANADSHPPAKPANANLLPSKITVEVTFEFNDTIGQKPDTGSHIVLIPKDIKSIPVSVLFLRGFSSSSIDGDSKALEKAGAYYAKVGGSGRAILNRVRPGNYRMYVISEKTNCNANVRDLHAKLYRQIFPGMAAELVAFKNLHQEIFEVGEQEDLEFSHDFGLTAF